MFSQSEKNPDFSLDTVIKDAGESLEWGNEKSIYLGKVIRELRKENKMSQEMLAKESNLDRGTVIRLEEGRAKGISLETLHKMAKPLKTDLVTIFRKFEALHLGDEVKNDVNKIEYSMEYPKYGLEVYSFLSREESVFIGKVSLNPKATLDSSFFEAVRVICIHVEKGTLLLAQGKEERLIKAGDHCVLMGTGYFEIYNSDQLKAAEFMLITYPTFI